MDVITNLLSSPKGITNLVASVGVEKLNDLKNVITSPKVIPYSSPTVVGVLQAIYSYGNIFNVILFLWFIVMIVKQFSGIFSDKAKEMVDYINEILFGNSGIIPVLFSFWIAIVTSIILIPSIIDLTGLLQKITQIITVVTGKL